MESPIERIRGRIIDIDERGVLTVRARYDNVDRLIRRKYKTVNIELIDGRPISERQRRMCYAMIREISDWMGQGNGETFRELVKESRKLDFMVNEIHENADRLFSLSDAPVSLVAAFQKYLVHFIIENGIPVRKPLYAYVDDMQDYLYYCLIHKTCAVCGRPADLHHIDRVGMGRNREEMVHEGMECMSLCRTHHEEVHSLGEKEFFARYHFDRGIELDKTLCKIYKLKTGGERA